MTSMLYAPHQCTASPEEELTKMLAQKISAALSIMGSGYILALVGGKWRKKKSSVDPYQRIMAMYSVYDILFSFFFWFMGSWMTPTETGWLGASGNTVTCSIQGFAHSAFGLGSILYQMLLSLQMMLLVTFMWTPRKFAEKVEFRMHWVILILMIIFGSIPLFLQGYNPTCGQCLEYPLPVWCGDWSFGDGTTECVRGNPTLGNIYFFLGLFAVGVTTLFCTVAMIVIYRTVYNQEERNSRYGFAGNNEANHSQSKRIRKSMLLYTSSFYICWILPFALWYVPMLMAQPALQVIAYALAPLMGFLNMMVFIQPKCIKYQKDHPGTCLVAAYYRTMFSIPIKLVVGLWGSAEQTEPSNHTPADDDDDIGFGSYNEHVLVAEGETAAAQISG